MSYKAFAALKDHVEIETLKTMSYEEINALLNKQKSRIDELENGSTVSLRDRFAMAALQGFCASGDYDGQSWDRDIASDAYTAADAMLEERLRRLEILT